MVNHQPSRWFVSYALALFLTALPVGIVTILVAPSTLAAPLLLLIVAASLSENAALPLPRGGTTSVGFALIVAAALMYGPVGAGLVALSITTTYREIRARKPLFEILGNAGMLVLSAVIPAWAYLHLGGRILSGPRGHLSPMTATDFSGMILPILIFAVGFLVMNLGLVAIALWLRDHVRPSVFLRSVFSSAIPVQASLAVVGVAIAQTMTVHPLALALLVFPLVVARQTYQRYMELKSMYLDTVRSLVAALEAKDSYTRGHSERVARYATSAARELGLDEDCIERLGMAAQLHDLGKVAVSLHTLGKPSGLTASEYEEVQRHPVTGAEIVCGVPALQNLEAIIRYHHERYDGAGYLAGLSGESIPLESRLLAIADSYDAMTTHRAYREGISQADAIREIRDCAGSQFDPSLAEVFIASIQRGAHDA